MRSLARCCALGSLLVLCACAREMPLIATAVPDSADKSPEAVSRSQTPGKAFDASLANTFVRVPQSYVLIVSRTAMHVGEAVAKVTVSTGTGAVDGLKVCAGGLRGGIPDPTVALIFLGVCASVGASIGAATALFEIVEPLLPSQYD